MFSTSSRDKEIRNLRQKDPKRWRYRVLGEMYHLSEQRVRQICVEETHEDIFEKRADILSKYALRLRSLNEEEISAEIAMLTASSRIKENVLKRGLLVVTAIGCSSQEIAMYGIALGSAECPVFYEDRGKQLFEFTLSETRVIVDSLLDRKARNNGVGKYLFDSLRIKGECRYDFPKNSDPLAFYCKASGNGKYAVTLLGSYSHELIGRLSRSRQQLRAITVTRNIRVRRRELRAQGLNTRLVKRELPRALAGASGNFKLHFQNSQITCSDAIMVIAYAAKLDRHWVRNRLVRSLDKRSVASLRLKGGFVFRVDLACEWRGLLDLSSPVQIRTTDDNTHGAYRRLRNALRKRLKKERKARVAAQKRYLLEKKIQKTHRHLVA